MKQNGVLEWFQNKCSGKFEGLNTKEIDKYFIGFENVLIFGTIPA
jgi:hypothetical protein